MNTLYWKIEKIKLNKPKANVFYLVFLSSMFWWFVFGKKRKVYHKTLQKELINNTQKFTKKSAIYLACCEGQILRILSKMTEEYAF